ncbi:MAG: transcription termination/antitermination factor NusG [Betaproteobacteria bacterium AqS2]|uniref:Transcription termination/antitermination protein NusG n=1 Tax=Candidatus Amphirhobacter heronislandensis TaxID=1732024 RepID=A0A930UH71_9GAMM|nr:transcription termination/antitermination factor NusG [Betaproteobacteria bacterium AqS2]
MELMVNWYCVHVKANREKSFRQLLAQRIEQACEKDPDVKEQFGEIFSPAEQVVEMKNKKQKVSKRVFFPNYIFIQMEMNHKTWHIINQMSMTRGFVGDTNSGPSANASVSIDEDSWLPPQPVTMAEIDKIRSRVDEGMEKPRPKVMFEIGESVRIKDGPFTNFNGTVNDINYDTSRISVAVSVFNRPTDIQLDFEQVEKM